MAVSWEWPSLLQDVELSDLKAIQNKVHAGRYRADAQSREWVGNMVAEVLGIDTGSKGGRTKVKRLLALWTKNRMFKVVERKDGTRQARSFVEVDLWATS